MTTTKSIKINVGGTIFETTQDTLKKSTYFNSFLNRWLEKETIPFIDRSPHIFKHVLSLLRDPEYLYPKNYISELDFYGITEKNINDYGCKIEMLGSIVGGILAGSGSKIFENPNRRRNYRIYD